MADTYTLIKPFTAKVDGNGNAFVEVTHSIHGLAWQVMQVGIGLGQPAPSPQIAAMVNGIPFVSSVVLAPSVFASIVGSVPLAMTTELTGPPYPTLEAGDKLSIGVTGATPGDTFLVGAYVNEIDSPASAAALTHSGANAYLPRSGTRRW